MIEYEHKVQYYETDKMAIVHHSNYIRWFESARINYLEKVGIDYVRLEEEGLLSPVVDIYSKYKSMVKFGDTVIIETTLLKYTGIIFEVGYVIKDKRTGQIRTTGNSKHCFINAEGKPVSLKKSCPWAHEIFERTFKDDGSKE